jgi:hypothetical protein
VAPNPTPTLITLVTAGADSSPRTEADVGEESQVAGFITLNPPDGTITTRTPKEIDALLASTTGDAALPEVVFIPELRFPLASPRTQQR